MFDLDSLSRVVVAKEGPRVEVPSLYLTGDSPRVRKSDPITSHQAADGSNRAKSKQAVFTKLRVHKHLAAYELESLLPDWSPSRIRTALKELEKDGLVVRTDRTRPTRFGKQAHVWEASK
jgi:hypothetical protein